MLFSRIKRTLPEQVFTIMKNNHSAALVDGDVVQLDSAAATADLGNAVKQSPATINALGIIGVVSGPDIPIGEYGPILIYGVHNNAKGLAAINAALVGIINSGTAGTLTIATAADDPASVLGWSLAAVSGGRGKVFLRNM